MSEAELVYKLSVLRRQINAQVDPRSRDAEDHELVLEYKLLNRELFLQYKTIFAYMFDERRNNLIAEYILLGGSGE